jgi:hypothetical protein
MSHTLTEATTFPSTVTVPDAGDARTAASVNVAFQALADRTRNLYNLTNGIADSLDWSGQISGDGSATINVGGIRSFVRNGVNYGAAPGTVVTSGLANNTWYYVYAYIGAGIQYEYNTTVPDASLVYKSGDATRRYLGCFRTNGSAAPVAFRGVNGRYVLSRPQQVLAAASYGSVLFRATSLVSGVPPHSRMARLRTVLLSLAAGVVGNLVLRATGEASASGEHTVGQLTNANGNATWEGLLATDASQSIDHKLTNINHAVDMFVTGFEEG